MAERPQLLAMAAAIVSAHVSRNAVAVDQLPGLIQHVFNALATAEYAVTASPKAEPAVAVRRSIFADHVVCLGCGKHLTMLKRHLMTDHKMTPERATSLSAGGDCGLTPHCCDQMATASLLAWNLSTPRCKVRGGIPHQLHQELSGRLPAVDVACQ